MRLTCQALTVALYEEVSQATVKTQLLVRERLICQTLTAALYELVSQAEVIRAPCIFFKSGDRCFTTRMLILMRLTSQALTAAP